jgi:hypothetical protein
MIQPDGAPPSWTYFPVGPFIKNIAVLHKLSTLQYSVLASQYRLSCQPYKFTQASDLIGKKHVTDPYYL